MLTMLVERDILKQISRSYDSKVEAWPQDQIIRVTSDYGNCVDVVKLLIHPLENFKASVINPATELDQSSATHRAMLDDAMVRLIEEHTSTIVRRKPKTVSMICALTIYC